VCLSSKSNVEMIERLTKVDRRRNRIESMHRKKREMDVCTEDALGKELNLMV